MTGQWRVFSLLGMLGFLLLVGKTFMPAGPQIVDAVQETRTSTQSILTFKLEQPGAPIVLSSQPFPINPQQPVTLGVYLNTNGQPVTGAQVVGLFQGLAVADPKVEVSAEVPVQTLISESSVAGFAVMLASASPSQLLSTTEPKKLFVVSFVPAQEGQLTITFDATRNIVSTLEGQNHLEVPQTLTFTVGKDGGSAIVDFHPDLKPRWIGWVGVMILVLLGLVGGLWGWAQFKAIVHKKEV